MEGTEEGENERYYEKVRERQTDTKTKRQRQREGEGNHLYLER